MKCRNTGIALCACIIVATTSLVSLGAIYEIRPNEGLSQDTYVYENFAGSAMFNNGNLGTLPGFTDKLGIAKTTTAPATHNTHALVAFDLTTSNIDPDDVIGATLKFTSAPRLDFYQAPSAQFPATLEAYANLAGWTEAGVTWATKPGASASLLGSQSVSGDNQLLSFSSPALVTLVQSWLTTPASNLGVQLIQAAEVHNGQGRVGITLYSADNTNLANVPYLEITTLPEPSGFALTAIAAIALGGFRRRRLAQKRASACRGSM